MPAAPAGDAAETDSAAISAMTKKTRRSEA